MGTPRMIADLITTGVGIVLLLTALAVGYAIRGFYDGWHDGPDSHEPDRHVFAGAAGYALGWRWRRRVQNMLRREHAQTQRELWDMIDRNIAAGYDAAIRRPIDDPTDIDPDNEDTR